MNSLSAPFQGLQPDSGDDHIPAEPAVSTLIVGSGVDAFLSVLIGLAGNEPWRGLSARSTLREWQSYWAESGVLSALMAASLPASRGAWSVNDIAIPSAWSGVQISDSELPSHGLELFLENEKRIFNALANTFGTRYKPELRRLRRTRNLRPRPVLSLFTCMSRKLDAPLYAWAQVWHYLDTLRSMHDALAGRIMPLPISRLLGNTGIRVGDTGIRVYPSAVGAAECGVDAATVQYEIALSSVTTSSYVVLGTSCVTRDGLQIFRMASAVNQDMLPLDIVSMHHGRQHHATLLPQWCSLALAVNRVANHEQLSGGEIPGMRDDDRWHLLGLRIRRCLDAGDQAASLAGANGFNLPHQAEHLDTVAPGQIQGQQPMEFRHYRMPGVYPDAWHTSRGRDELLIRYMGVGEFVQTRWLQATAIDIGLYDPKTVVAVEAQDGAGVDCGKGTASLADQIYMALLPNGNFQSKGAYASRFLVYANNDSLVGRHGSSLYRVALLSLFLEESEYLRRRSNHDVLPHVVGSAGADRTHPDRIVIGADRQSLMLVRRVVGVLRRMGLSQGDITLWARQVLFDIASKLTIDLGTRYQLVRSQDKRYEIKALPYWHSLASSDTDLSEVERLFGGSVQIQEDLGVSLVRNPNCLILLGRHIGVPSSTLIKALATSYEKLALSAQSYISVFHSLAEMLGEYLTFNQVQEFNRSISQMEAVAGISCSAQPNNDVVPSVALHISEKGVEP